MATTMGTSSTTSDSTAATATASAIALAGVYPASVTPLAADGRIDERAFAAHVGWLLERGVDGVVAFGTNGEGPILGGAEKTAALSALLAQIPDAPLIATVARAGLVEALEEVRALNELPLRAVMVLPPHYYKPVTADGLRRFFEPIIAASRHPVILYHIPKYAVAIPIELVTALDVWGVKDSGSDLEYTTAVIATGRGVLLGTEDDLLTRLRTGANGLISALANFVPELVVRAYRLARREGGGGDEAEERDLASRLAEIRVRSKAHGIAGLKRLAERRHGIALGGVRPPLLPAPHGYDGRDVYELVDASQLAPTAAAPAR